MRLLDKLTLEFTNCTITGIAAMGKTVVTVRIPQPMNHATLTKTLNDLELMMVTQLRASLRGVRIQIDAAHELENEIVNLLSFPTGSDIESAKF